MVVDESRAWTAPPGQSESPDGDGPWSREHIIREFGISERLFLIKYVSYGMALRTGGATSHWNDDVDELALETGALTEDEIRLAETDLHQAIMNRVKLALVMGGFESRENTDE